MPARRRRKGNLDSLNAAELRLAGDVLQSAMSTRNGRRAVLAIVVLVLLCLVGWWLWENELRPRHPAGPTVRIATWNLRQFSENRKGVDLKLMADIIHESHFDVIAIQEVKREGEEIDRLLGALGTPWRSTSLSDMTGNHERFTFIYDGDHVQEIGTAHTIGTADAVIFDRAPYQASFRAGQFDFTLITSHLFYGDNAAGHARRRTEAQTLAKFAESYAQRSTEKDVIILGDFNETRGHENLTAFTAIGWEECNADPSNLAGTEIYDQILIDPKFTKEWNGVAGSIHFDETRLGGNDKLALEKISDHRPVYADFVTNLLDDD